MPRMAMHKSKLKKDPSSGAYEGNAMSVTLRWQARKLEFQLPFAKLEHTELVKMCNDD